MSKTWGGMQMFVENKLNPDDRRREMVYHNFNRNLQDIVKAGLDSGAKVLLSTVAVTLKDCPPFASTDVTNLSAADATAYDKALADATSAESKGDFAAALPQLEAAAKSFPQSAELQFHLGLCALQISNAPAARAHFQSACDLDTLPFRADTRINGMIAQMANRFPNANLRVFDAAAGLAPAGISGNETFYEHVHFNFDGNYRLARAWAAQIESMLALAPANYAKSDWLSQETCEDRLGLTDWNRSAVVESVMQRMYSPPLSTQAGNAQRLEALRAWGRELHARMTSDAAKHAREIYLDAIKRAPDDYYLHENYAAFLVGNKEFAAATQEWRRVRELTPQDFVANYRLAEVLVDENKLDEAAPLLLDALSSHPGFTEGWLKLGQLHAAQAKLDLALGRTHARAPIASPGPGGLLRTRPRALAPEPFAGFARQFSRGRPAQAGLLGGALYTRRRTRHA